MTYPMVCTDENFVIDNDGKLRLASWSVPRLVADRIASSGADGALLQETELPGKMLIDMSIVWYSDAPTEQMLRIRVTRGPKAWITSNPNAVQFRDRWTWAINDEPDPPVTSGIYNSQAGSAIDLGTNTVAEPNPGVQWMWADAHSSDEWVGPFVRGDMFHLKYRCYVWNPPPWSDNANKGSPRHEASAKYARVQLEAWPSQGTVVLG